MEDLDALDDEIEEMMTMFKKCFDRFSDSGCHFPKYHMSLHLTSVIQEWGSMRIVDTCFGEVSN